MKLELWKCQHSEPTWMGTAGGGMQPTPCGAFVYKEVGDVEPTVCASGHVLKMASQGLYEFEEERVS